MKPPLHLVGSEYGVELVPDEHVFRIIVALLELEAEALYFLVVSI